jgi:hypothetical protein
VLHKMCSPITQKMLERDSSSKLDDRELRAGLRVLNISRNNLDDSGCAIIFDAAARCASLQILYCEDNKASFMAGKSLAKLLDGDETDSGLIEVHIGWNLLRGSASTDVAVALQRNYRLKVLDVSWNNFGAADTCAALSQVLLKNDCMQMLDLSHNSIDGKSGAMLAEGLERNESLLRFIINDNPIGLTAARLLMRASPKGNKERELSMLRCGCSNIAKEASVFDPSSPDGDYELDMSNPYSAVVLEHIIRHISFSTGIFASKDPKLPGFAELDGRKWNCPSYNALKEGRANLPTTGILAFRFESVRKIAGEDDALNEDEMECIERLFKAATQGTDREALVNTITSGNTFLKSEQVGVLMTKYMKSAYEQVKLVTQCMFRIVDQAARKSLVAMLSPEALALFKRSTSQDARDFTPNNPTGHYKMDMARAADRDMLSRLLEVRDIAYNESLKRFKTGRPGDLPCNKTVPLDFVMINVTVDGGAVSLPASGWKLPRVGVVELDFVEPRHPTADTALLDASDMVLLMRPNGRRWIDWKLQVM